MAVFDGGVFDSGVFDAGATTVESSFSANAVIAKTASGSFSASAFVYLPGDPRRTTQVARLVVAETTPAARTTDVVRLTAALPGAPTVRTTGVVRLVVADRLQGFTADAYITGTPVSGSFTADAQLKRTYTTSFSAASIRSQSYTNTFSANAEITRTTSGSFTASAVIQKTITPQLTVEAEIGSASVSGSIGASAVLRKTISNSFTASAVRSQTQSLSFTASAIISLGKGGSITADAIRKQVVEQSFAAAASLVATPVGSFSASAILFREQSWTFDAQAELATHYFHAEAVIRKTTEESFSASASLYIVQTGSFTVSAILSATRIFLSASDPFDRVTASSLGTGPMGTWGEYAPSSAPFSTDGQYAIANNGMSPAASNYYLQTSLPASIAGGRKTVTVRFRWPQLPTYGPNSVAMIGFDLYDDPDWVDEVYFDITYTHQTEPAQLIYYLGTYVDGGTWVSSTPQVTRLPTAGEWYLLKTEIDPVAKTVKGKVWWEGESEPGWLAYFDNADLDLIDQDPHLFAYWRNGQGDGISFGGIGSWATDYIRFVGDGPGIALDAVIYKPEFRADAVIRVPDQQGSFSAAAEILLRRTGSFSASAVIQKTITIGAGTTFLDLYDRVVSNALGNDYTTVASSGTFGVDGNYAYAASHSYFTVHNTSIPYQGDVVATFDFRTQDITDGNGWWQYFYIELNKWYFYTYPNDTVSSSPSSYYWVFWGDNGYINLDLGTWYRVKVEQIDRTRRFKLWKVSDPEPETWLSETTISLSATAAPFEMELDGADNAPSYFDNLTVIPSTVGPTISSVILKSGIEQTFVAQAEIVEDPYFQVQAEISPRNFSASALFRKVTPGSLKIDAKIVWPPLVPTLISIHNRDNTWHSHADYDTTITLSTPVGTATGTVADALALLEDLLEKRERGEPF